MLSNSANQLDVFPTPSHQVTRWNLVLCLVRKIKLAPVAVLFDWMITRVCDEGVVLDMTSKAQASILDKTKSSVLQLNKTRASGCNSSRKSQIPQTSLSGIARHMKHITESTTQCKKRTAAINRTKTKNKAPQKVTSQSHVEKHTFNAFVRRLASQETLQM